MKAQPISAATESMTSSCSFCGRLASSRRESRRASSRCAISGMCARSEYGPTLGRPARLCMKASYAGFSFSAIWALVTSGMRAMRWGLLSAQPRARVHLQQDAAAHGVPLRREGDRLSDDVKVAPALGQAALAPVRRAATVLVHQIHRLASALGGVDGGQPAAGPLIEGGLVAGRDGVPDLRDRRAAVGATGVQNRVCVSARVLDLRVV